MSNLESTTMYMHSKDANQLMLLAARNGMTTSALVRLTVRDLIIKGDKQVAQMLKEHSLDLKTEQLRRAKNAKRKRVVEREKAFENLKKVRAT